MGLITQLTTLKTEDFPSQKEWIGKLLGPLNEFLTSIVPTINGNVTLGDNIPCVTKSLAFTYGGETDYPKQFSWPFPVKPIEVRVCSATEDSQPIAVVIKWSYSLASISVTGIYKINADGVSVLSPGSVYNIVLRGQF